MFQLKTVGGDPEFFIKNEKGEYIPFYMFLEDNPEFDRTLGLKHLGVRVYPDNVAGEIGFSPVTTAGFSSTIQTIKEALAKELDKFGYSAVFYRDAVEFKSSYLKDGRAQRIGCLPFLVLEEGVRKSPPYSDNKRFIGGHVHLGFAYNGELSRQKINELLVKVCDAVLYKEFLPSDERAKVYGMKGAFRLKSYGIEYRSLSPHWVDNSVVLTDLLLKVEEVMGKLLKKLEK